MSRLIKSFAFALNGIKSCFSKEPNFKIHSGIAIGVIAAGICFHISLTEWFLMLICMGSVLWMEMVNTAIEQLCNMVYDQPHPGIKIIKDISAGAVLVSAIIAAICGAIVFIPKIFLLLK